MAWRTRASGVDFEHRHAGAAMTQKRRTIAGTRRIY